MRSATQGFLFAIVVAALLPRPAAAQDVGIGKVYRIAVEKKSVDSTRRAEIWSTRAGVRSQVRRDARLQVRDVVLLRQPTIVDLRFDQPGLASEAYLGSHELGSVGGYEILGGDVTSLTALQLVIRQGVMVIQQARGAVRVRLIGNTVDVHGTTVLFVVDSLTQTGTVFLQDGHITFPEYDMVGIGENRAWHLKPNQRPEEFVPTGDQLKQWRSEVRYVTYSAWHQTPFWQTPTFLIPAAAIGVVGGCAVAGCFDGGGDTPALETSRGGVGATIP